MCRYGAEDAIGHVKCYFGMKDKPDLTRRLSPSDATPGTVVDIVPRNGNIACMASRGATGIIEQATEARSPPGIKPQIARPVDGTVVVKLQEIHAPALLLDCK